MTELGEVNVHNNQMRVMGIAVDSRVNHMFSISESGYLIVTNLDDVAALNSKFLSSQNLSSSGLKAMIYDSHRNVLFIASGMGQIFILNSLPSTPELLTTITTDQQVCIRGLTRSVQTDDYWASFTASKVGGLN